MIALHNSARCAVTSPTSPVFLPSFNIPQEDMKHIGVLALRADIKRGGKMPAESLRINIDDTESLDRNFSDAFMSRKSSITSAIEWLAEKVGATSGGDDDEESQDQEEEVEEEIDDDPNSDFGAD